MKKILYSLLFIFLLISCLSCASAQDISSLQNVRYGIYPEKVRFVFEFDSEAPANHSYFQSLPLPDYCIVIPKCRAKSELIKKIPFEKDKLIYCLNTEQKGTEAVGVSILLRYAIPKENIKTSILCENGKGKLVVDIFRAFSKKTKYSVSENIQLTTEEYATADGYVRLNDLSVTPYPKGQAYFDIVMPKDKREKVSSMMNRTDAIAAVNGGFFAWDGGKPLGLLYRYGKLVAPHVDRRPPRTCFGILMDGSPIIDRMTAKDGKILTTSGNEVNNPAFVIGGGPNLVSGGQSAVNADEEALGKKGNDITRIAGRTGLGYDAQGKIHFFTATGYTDSHKEGLKLEPFAQKMIQAGIVSGMNLDGGGSSVMNLQKTDISKPAGVKISERPVGNAVAVFSKEKLLTPYKIAVSADKNEFNSDGKDFALLKLTVSDAQGSPVPDGTEIKLIPSFGECPFYASVSGGEISVQIGKTQKSGVMSLSAEGGAVASEIWKGKCLPGTPSAYSAKLVETPGAALDAANLFRVDLACEDINANRIQDAKLRLEITDDTGMKIFERSVSTSSSGGVSIYISGEFRDRVLKIFDGEKVVGELKLITKKAETVSIPKAPETETPDGETSIPETQQELPAPSDNSEAPDNDEALND